MTRDPETLAVNAFKAERDLLNQAHDALTAWEQPSKFDKYDFPIPAVEVRAILRTFRDVLEIARDYHNAAADLVG